MVSKFRSRPNQTVDEVHQKRNIPVYLWNGFLLKTLHFKTDRSDHDVDFVVNDKQVFLPLTFAVEFARNLDRTC